MSIASPLRRHWPLWAACAFFLLVGALVLDDYGGWSDTWPQHAIGRAALDYLAGDGDRAFDQLRDTPSRYYGTAFEAPLVLLLERILGLEDSRDVLLGRHLLTHLFFLTGGVFCYLLVLRMCNSRALALVATVLFLLHPRIYAHSFFNSKDVPFLAAFMIALYLTHRAFRRDTLGAFLLCGVGAGLLVNLRIMGVILVAAVLALRALDVAFAGSAHERKRVLLTAGAFALAALLTYYASLPALWTDPVGSFAELTRTLGSHPYQPPRLFRGELLETADGPPFDYVPVWVGITTPPATLLLALLGAVALAGRALRHPRHILHNGPLRFGLLLALLPVATVAAVVVLDSILYANWRHLFFLYGPLLLLAVLGLHRLGALLRGRRMRAGMYALTGAAIAVSVVSLVRIHPQQNHSFTALTDRSTPERLGSRYPMDPWEHSAGSMLAAIVEEHATGRLFVSDTLNDTRLLAPDERERLTVTRDFRSGETNFLALPNTEGCPPASAQPSAVFGAVRIYATTLWCVVDPVAYLGGYRREALATEPLVRSRVDAHRVGDVMVYLRDGCLPDDLYARFFLRYGFGESRFSFAEQGARIDGDCVAAVPLPAWPIARIETGEVTPDRAMVRGAAMAVLRAVADDPPRARSRFDIWRTDDGRTLLYARDECSAEDVETRFFLHVYPSDERVLRERRAEYGFNNRNFDFPEFGVRLEDGSCIATVPLPAWSIANIHTGQYDDTGQRWSVRFAAMPPHIEPEALAGEPLARSVFTIHLHDGALLYVRDGCTDGDAAASFLLHVVPIDLRDLPPQQAQYGFDNLDFFLWERGARIDDRCIAVVPLPDYPIANIHTGQYDDTGALWTARFAVTPPRIEPQALAGEPLARSAFDVHYHDGALLYVRDMCTDGDAAVAFFLHAFPVDEGDLPDQRREYGFDNLDFLLWERGARIDERCIAVVPLPDYPIATVRTGQYDDTGQLWAVEFALPDGE